MMFGTQHANFPKTLLTVWVAILPTFVLADDLTGQAQDDPKDLQPVPEISSQPIPPTGTILFLPMPGWARGADMSSMPAQLKPLGKAPVAAAAPAPAPLAPPPETPAVVATPAKSASQSKPSRATVQPTPPSLIAVSPFLQWIQSNPQAAAAQARQQANSYRAPAPSDAGASNGPGNNATGPTGGNENPYWLPPLIDSPNFGSGAVGGSSAAIYSTPQR